jgi:hypothetical protein
MKNSEQKQDTTDNKPTTGSKVGQAEEDNPNRKKAAKDISAQDHSITEDKQISNSRRSAPAWPQQTLD